VYLVLGFVVFIKTPLYCFPLMGKESPLRNKPKEILPFELDTFVTVTVKSLVESFSQQKEVKRKKTKYIECFIVTLTT
jgi:hypothetical protein